MANAHLDSLPAWAKELSEKYYSRTITMFVLHGNARDLVAFRHDAALEFCALSRFLRSGLFGQRDIVVTYDRGGGLSFAEPRMQEDFRQAISGYDQFHGTSYATALPRNPDGVLNLLDNYLRLRIADGRKIALIVEFAETIAPAGDVSSLAADDRNALVTLKRWAQHPAFLSADLTICLVAENLSELNQGIVQNPGMAAISIPLPSEEERLEFIRAAGAFPAQDGLTPETLATLAAGLKRVQVRNLLSQAVENRQPLTLKFLAARKKDLIEAESGGFLEFVQSRFDLSIDRKSTRLNSSHLVISYAVFCLKKKKTNKHIESGRKEPSETCG